MRFSFIMFGLVVAAAAGCQNKSDQKAEAQEHWNNTRATILMGVAQDQYKAQDFDKCNETLSKAMRMSPNAPQLHVLAAKVQIEQGHLELAEKELEVARRFGPAEPEPYYLSGVIYQRWQKPQTALEFYRQAGQRAPAELSYILAEGEMLVALERVPEALALLQAKVSYFENSAAIRDAVAQLLVQSGRYADAIKMFRQASVLAEKDDGIRERLALACYADKQYGPCAKVLTRLTATDAFAKRADLLELQGECQLQIGDSRMAVRSLTAATEINAYSARLWQNLGRAILDTGDLKRADYALRRSLGVDASIGETHLLIGYVQLRESKFDAALKSFKTANDLDKADTTAICMVGYTLTKMGREREAAAFYAQALRVKPGDDMASELMAQIDK
ncbi:MAG TPA: tetratricopeptide repeat protein [Tepidisphaeraceae bacterium]|jgi:Flp pilus assembly protein TadD